MSLPVGARRPVLIHSGLAPLTVLRAERIDRSRLSLVSKFAAALREDPHQPLLSTQTSPSYPKLILLSSQPLVLQVYAAQPSPPIPHASLTWDLDRVGLSGDSVLPAAERPWSKKERSESQAILGP